MTGQLSLSAFTAKELEVAWAAAVGLTGRETAEWLGVPVEAVRDRQRRVRERAKARTMPQAVAQMLRLRHGLPLRVGPRGVSRRTPTAMPIRADRAREAISRGADPLLALSYVLWPPEGYEDEQVAA